MASKIQIQSGNNRNTRFLPDLNFKIKLHIPFSISSGKKMSMNFSTLCGNEEVSNSHKLRKIMFELLGCENQNDFDKKYKEEARIIGKKLLEDIKKKNNLKGEDFFSPVFRTKIEEALKNEKI